MFLLPFNMTDTSKLLCRQTRKTFPSTPLKHISHVCNRHPILPSTHPPSLPLLLLLLFHQLQQTTGLLPFWSTDSSPAFSLGPDSRETACHPACQPPFRNINGDAWQTETDRHTHTQWLCCVYLYVCFLFCSQHIWSIIFQLATSCSSWILDPDPGPWTFFRRSMLLSFSWTNDTDAVTVINSSQVTNLESMSRVQAAASETEEWCQPQIM